MVWNGIAATPLARPRGMSVATAVGINDSGQIAGLASPFFGGPSLGVTWTGERAVFLDQAGGRSSAVIGINNAGDIVLQSANRQLSPLPANASTGARNIRAASERHAVAWVASCHRSEPLGPPIGKRSQTFEPSSAAAARRPGIAGWGLSEGSGCILGRQEREHVLGLPYVVRPRCVAAQPRSTLDSADVEAAIVGAVLWRTLVYDRD